MYHIPTYKALVSLIPGGCPQILDFLYDVNEAGRLRRCFQEERRTTGEEVKTHLHCLVEENGELLDEQTRQSAGGDYYQVDARKCLTPWLGQWIPVPFLRIRDQKWTDDGGDRFECGPSNWARVRLVMPDDAPSRLRVVLAFDMKVEAPPQDTELYFALSPEDVAAHATFRLAHRTRDNAWFLNEDWVDEWLRNVWERQFQRKRRPESDHVLEYMASYLTMLEVLQLAIQDVTVQTINPKREHPIDVDLVLDIGNSRTTGILVETRTQHITNLNDSYLLQLRDMDQPEHVYVEPFETRVEFSEVSFGNDALSRRSGRRTSAFTWPSPVRIGPEAARLSTLAVCAEGTTGMSSPKRYLWDERDWQPSWRYNTKGGQEPMVTRGPLSKKVNASGTPLCCLQDRVVRRNRYLRRQEQDIAFESLFTRSSLMMFLLVEVLQHALMTINSPGQRARRELPNVPRRLRQVIFTVPAGMPLAEQRIYRRWADWAVRVLWETLDWQEYYVEARAQGRAPRSDYRFNPLVRCNWDEATCTQLVYIYNEVTRKFQGDAHHLFHLLGTRRDARKYGDNPSVRVATIDIGGGTTDLSITTFELESDSTATARMRPHLEFRDGFNVAGDDILRDIVNKHVLPAIGDAVVSHGVRDARAFLAQMFGRDVMDSSQENRNRRAQFARQLGAPAALCVLSAYEKANLMAGDAGFSCTLGDFFRRAAEDATEDAAEKGGHAWPFMQHPLPHDAVIDYVESAVHGVTGQTDFHLLETPIRIDPLLVDRTIRESMGRVLANLCEVIQLYDCDILLLTGRPSRWQAIVSSVFAKLPVPPDRILPMSQFHVGSWYPFADALGNITDPKTTVVVGAILCALAEGHLEGFSFDPSLLALGSTARYIGEMDINGQIRKPKVWFEVDVARRDAQEYTHEVQFAGPIAIGFRQLEVERWTTTRFYLMDFADEDARRKASSHLPYKITLKLTLGEQDAMSDDPDEKERDEGEFSIEEILARDGDDWIPVSEKEVEIRLQTLPLDEGFWLDTGIVYQAV